MESRMMNYGMRMYDPLLGRFLSVDPLWQGFRSLSPYQYAYNSPLSYKDPTGLAPQKEQGEKVLTVLMDPRIPDKYAQLVGLNNFKMSDRQIELQLRAYTNLNAAFGRYLAEQNGFGRSSTTDGSTSGGGGGRDGSTESDNGTENRKTGVYAEDNKSKIAIQKSVENKYEKYVSFDAEGKVIIDNKNPAILKALQDNPSSNFAKLLVLANNEKEAYFVKSIGFNIGFEFHCDDWSGGTKTSFSSLTNDNYGYPVYGIFLASLLDYALVKMYSDYNTNSEYRLTTCILAERNQIYLSIGNQMDIYAAHELYIHAYNHLEGLPWWHSGIPNDDINRMRIEKNSRK